MVYEYRLSVDSTKTILDKTVVVIPTNHKIHSSTADNVFVGVTWSERIVFAVIDLSYCYYIYVFDLLVFTSWYVTFLLLSFSLLFFYILTLLPLLLLLLRDPLLFYVLFFMLLLLLFLFKNYVKEGCVLLLSCCCWVVTPLAWPQHLLVVPFIFCNGVTSFPSLPYAILSNISITSRTLHPARETAIIVLIYASSMLNGKSRRGATPGYGFFCTSQACLVVASDDTTDGSELASR